jgi:hypothetical protein
MPHQSRRAASQEGSSRVMQVQKLGKCRADATDLDLRAVSWEALLVWVRCCARWLEDELLGAVAGGLHTLCASCVAQLRNLFRTSADPDLTFERRCKRCQLT